MYFEMKYKWKIKTRDYHMSESWIFQADSREEAESKMRDIVKNQFIALLDEVQFKYSINDDGDDIVIDLENGKTIMCFDFRLTKYL